jgi:hypothetical protein
MKYYSAIMKSEIMSFSGKFMELEVIMLSEISQTEKEKYCMFSLICRHECEIGRLLGVETNTKGEGKRRG